MTYRLEINQLDAENLMVFLRHIHNGSSNLFDTIYYQLNGFPELKKVSQEFEIVYPKFCNGIGDAISDYINNLEWYMETFRTNAKVLDQISLGNIVDFETNSKVLRGVVINKNNKDITVLYYNEQLQKYENRIISPKEIVKKHGLLKVNDNDNDNDENKGNPK